MDLVATRSPTTGTVTFSPGTTYMYQDLNEMGSTFRTFETSGPAPPVATTQPSGPGVSSTSIVGSEAPARPLGTLRAALTSRGRLALTRRGKPVSRLIAGRYTFVVSDPNRRWGFRLVNAGKRTVTVTSSRFVGRRTVTVGLSAGRWTLAGLGAATRFVVVKG